MERMSATGRLKRWLDTKLKRKQTEPEEPTSEAPTRPVRRLKPIEATEVADSVPLWHEAPTRNYVRKPVNDAVTHICFNKNTRKLTRPVKTHLLKKDPITRKVTKILLKDINGGATTVIYYGDGGKLIDF
jgi:hypothetical protein